MSFCQNCNKPECICMECHVKMMNLYEQQRIKEFLEDLNQTEYRTMAELIEKWEDKLISSPGGKF